MTKKMNFQKNQIMTRKNRDFMRFIKFDLTRVIGEKSEDMYIRNLPVINDQDVEEYNDWVIVTRSILEYRNS
tara:strand:+ start:213 stop:428 length:216 start_codon:yes stop_codon:yes gene_type:complete